MVGQRSLRLGWASAWAFTLLALTAFFYAAWRNATNPPGVDFAGFWAAGRMVVNGTPSLAYDVAAHGSLALSAGVKGLLPFPYPPWFLFVIGPFAVASFPAAFVMWVLATGSLFFFATSRTPLPYRLAFPAAVPNLLVGQNGFLLTGLFVMAADLLETSPWVAGILFGLLTIKPQIGLLIPVALAAGRHGKAFAGATLTAMALTVAAAICFGVHIYTAFLQSMTFLTRLMAATEWPWHKLASVFAFARFFGASQALASIVQGFAAVLAAVLTWRSWRRESPARVPLLAAATMLVPPYLFSYDALLLVVPFGWFIRRGCPGRAMTLWLCCVPPVLSYIDLYKGPNTIPIAAAFTLWALRREDSTCAVADLVTVDPLREGLA